MLAFARARPAQAIQLLVCSLGGAFLVAEPTGVFHEAPLVTELLVGRVLLYALIAVPLGDAARSLYGWSTDGRHPITAAEERPLDSLLRAAAFVGAAHLVGIVAWLELGVQLPRPLYPSGLAKLNHAALAGLVLFSASACRGVLGLYRYHRSGEVGAQHRREGRGRDGARRW